MVRPRGTDSARVISVIETKALRGEGSTEDPCRIVTQYWDMEGKLLAENDEGRGEADGKRKTERSPQKGGHDTAADG